MREEKNDTIDFSKANAFSPLSETKKRPTFGFDRIIEFAAKNVPQPTNSTKAKCWTLFLFKSVFSTITNNESNMRTHTAEPQRRGEEGGDRFDNIQKRTRASQTPLPIPPESSKVKRGQ